jgi:hypothetical protein
VRTAGAGVPYRSSWDSGVIALSVKLLTGSPKKDRKAQGPQTMGIGRRTDDMRAVTPTQRTDQAPRAKAGGVVERWKEQLAAGQDLTNDHSTDEQNINRFPSGEPHDRDHSGDQGLSDVGVLINLAVLALVLVGGYFLLMKLVEISRQEDCFLAGGRNCAALQMRSNR